MNAASFQPLVQQVSESATTRLGFAPRQVQLQAAEYLQQRNIVEMETGEGKTLTLAIAAILFAKPTGNRPKRSVCIATANDYLAERDAAWMQGVFQDMGLSSAAVVASTALDRRSAAYQCDIVYGTIREFGFDFLRATLAAQDSAPPVLSGIETGQPRFDVLMVDEADAVLIDEARTPLVISQTQHEPTDEATESCFRWAAEVAKQFQTPTDYVRVVDGAVALTTQGRSRIHHLKMPAAMNSLSMTTIIHAVERAVWVNETMKPQQQYIVRDKQIVIVHKFTGRSAPGKTFAAGVHQAIEAREGLPITPPQYVAARVSVQELVNKFAHVCGSTATATEDRRELKQVYATRVVQVSPHEPNRREVMPPCVCENEAQKWQQIIQETKAMMDGQRAVLIGTPSITKSEALADLLRDYNIAPVVLNAKNPESEAEIVRQAGQAGQVTVATNMAGRGTDIPLSEEVRQRGGLHVIVSEPHLAARIDRQLMGRCARQGDPGSARMFVCADDDLLQADQAGVTVGSSPSAGNTLKRIAKAQQMLQQRARLQRSQLTAQETRLSESLQTLGLDPHLNPPQE